VIVGGAGIAFTVANVIPDAGLIHPPTVTITLYEPVAATGAAGIEGFCKAEVKLLGPVQA